VAKHRGGAHGGHAALHVGRPATIDTIVTNLGAKRGVNLPIHTDDIEVAVHHQGWCIARAQTRHDIRAARSEFVNLDREAPIF
jgi:hypothetical protein